MSANYTVARLNHERGDIELASENDGADYFIHMIQYESEYYRSRVLSRSDIVELALRTNEECSRIREWIGDGALAITDEAWEYISLKGLMSNYEEYERGDISFASVHDFRSLVSVDVMLHNANDNMAIAFYGLPLAVVVRMREAWISEHGE